MDADLAGADGVAGTFHFGVMVEGLTRYAEDGWQDEEWDGTEATRKKIIERYMAKLDGMEFNDLVRLVPWLSYIRSREVPRRSATSPRASTTRPSCRTTLV